MKKLKSLEYAFFLLKLRDRSIGELREKMERKEYPSKEISETIDFLIAKNFLDDERFTRNFVRFKKSLKPVGKYYLQNKLRQKKIDNEIIEKVLTESSDEESEIEEAADHWLARNRKVPKKKLYEKLSRHLLSRGFEWEKVKEVIEEKLWYNKENNF